MRGYRTAEFRPLANDRKAYRRASYLKVPGQEERIKAHKTRIQKALKKGVV